MSQEASNAATLRHEKARAEAFGSTWPTRVRLSEAFEARYHVPRSQVWEGSRGGQRGHVHLYVRDGEAFQAGRIRRVQGETLCGKRAWYARPADGEELCPRCLEIGTRPDGRLSGLVAA